MRFLTLCTHDIQQITASSSWGRRFLQLSSQQGACRAATALKTKITSPHNVKTAHALKEGGMGSQFPSLKLKGYITQCDTWMFSWTIILKSSNSVHHWYNKNFYLKVKLTFITHAGYTWDITLQVFFKGLNVSEQKKKTLQQGHTESLCCSRQPSLAAAPACPLLSHLPSQAGQPLKQAWEVANHAAANTAESRAGGTHSSWGGPWSQSPEHGRGQPWDSWEGAGLHVCFICIKEHRKEKSKLHKQIQELQFRLKSLLPGPHQVMERFATAHLFDESDMV